MNPNGLSELLTITTLVGGVFAGAFQEPHNPHLEIIRQRRVTATKLMFISAGGALLTYGAGVLAAAHNHPELTPACNYLTTFLAGFAAGKAGSIIRPN